MRQAAKKRGLSVNQLADAAGLGRGHMSEILNCNKVPSIRTLKKIADALNVEVRDLIPPSSK